MQDYMSTPELPTSESIVLFLLSHLVYNPHFSFEACRSAVMSMVDSIAVHFGAHLPHHIVARCLTYPIRRYILLSQYIVKRMSSKAYCSKTHSIAPHMRGKSRPLAATGPFLLRSQGISYVIYVWKQLFAWHSVVNGKGSQ